MFEAKLVVEIPGLEALAAAIACRVQTVGAAADVPAQRRAECGVSPAPAPANSQAIPNLTSVPTAPISPVPVAHPAPPAVPTAPAPGFTVDQVGTAGADMIRDNPAKMPELLSLLQQFGVQAVAELTPDKLGPFATALRGLGAKL